MRNEVDKLGRFVIPIKYRRKLNIESGDELDVRLQKDTLIIKKAYPACIFCETKEDLLLFEEKMVCSACLKKLCNVISETK